MHIKRIEIQNLRNIEHFVWEQTKDDLAGWHVLIGDNGSGKSTVLRAISMALLGGRDIAGLRLNRDEWVREGSNEGRIKLSLERPALRGQLLLETNYDRELILFRGENTVDYKQIGVEEFDNFTAAFGPFRRFSGGDKSYEKMMRSLSNVRLSAHLSIFGEDVALSESLDWLIRLNYQRLEGKPEGELLTPIQRFINQEDFLPHGMVFESVSSEGVFFKDKEGSIVPVENLSDGYRSILSMTFEIIRQLFLIQGYPRNERTFSDDATRIITEGVVLIDEVDAHLHPSWQRTVGAWFTKHFPNMQFIVTTHSPLVCQAAINGSIWRLPTPGTDEESRPVERDSEEWKRLVYGNVLEAYSTDLFGENIDRSPQAQAKYKRLAQLFTKQRHEELSDDEEDELDELLDELPHTPSKYTANGGSE
jgi:predicted ATPase